ncbi:MAG: proline--tRNA ligase [Candidatus Liptonbacteria bacterium]|nr:proline--tRNA ligase [Candidatus Liptonbacteria bacterium]
MRQTKYFLKTSTTLASDESIVSARLLKQAGCVAESAAGRYYFLPLGHRVHQRIAQIIREEMNAAGAQEMTAPVLHPLELWQETNRTKSTGFELMRVKDRRGSEFALGGTAEEMFVDLVRKYTVSYRELPFHLYQFSSKFRDELRARGGLLRVREFMMKDGYSFHADEEDFRKTYEAMKKVYSRIFERVGLSTQIVESDNGYIGGEYCHEFITDSPAGESRYFVSADGQYAAHEDVAKFERYAESEPEEMRPREDVEGVGIIGVEELAKFLKIPVEKTTKTILFQTEKGEVIAAAVNGIYDINETKLRRAVGCYDLTLASEETVKRVTGAEIGYAGILDLPKEVRVVMDVSLRHRTNFECGANKTNYHSININFGRDLTAPEKFYDIALAEPGFTAPDGHGTLSERRGIEVGNIFQLGCHYSKLMAGATFTARDGEKRPYYMGCYGIGLGRTMAAVVEAHHDERGITWPESVAPFAAHLIALQGADGEAVYQKLCAAGAETLYDDRDESPGVKFTDADLIGIPWRLVKSAKTGDKVEVKRRNEKDVRLLPLDEAIRVIANGSTEIRW